MMQTLRRHPGLAAVLAVASLTGLILAAMLLLARKPEPERRDVPVPSVPEEISRPTAQPAPPPARPAGERPEAAPDWRESGTRLELAARTFAAAIEAARAGDPAARYHVARTVRFCQFADGRDGRTPDGARRACRDILSQPGLAGLGAEQAKDAWVPMLNDAVRAGDPRALGYAALHCVDGSPCDPLGGSDRNMSLASAQARVGRAIASGDPEAIFNAGLAIGDGSIGRNPVRGAAWLLVACARGYDCSAANDLNEALLCPSGQGGCGAGRNVEDTLQAGLGPGDYAEAYALAQEYAQLLEAGEPPVRTWAFGR